MAKLPTDSYDVLSEVFTYDPESGKLFWKISPGRRKKSGEEAGAIKNARVAGRTPKRYRYVGYNGWNTTVARVAWLLTYKEWPRNNMVYLDGDTLNTRIANLKLGDFCYGASDGALPQRKMTKAAQRHYGLKRYYGLTAEDYGRMFAEQKALCAICEEPEVRVTRSGELTTLHVDHNHVTGKVRALLCYRCNNALGAMRDRPDLLRKAADYLECHEASRET